MDQANSRDEALFEALNRKKKKKRRKIIRTVVIVVVLLAVLLVGGVLFLRRKVAQRFADSAKEVLSAEVTVGSISTQVSGSGTLMNVDEESLSIPAGITVDELLVSAHDSVTEGQLLVKVEPASVLTAMSSLQDSMSDLDSQITTAGSDAVSSNITAGVSGRVKQVFAQRGDDVAMCMYEHGALAVLSLDGYLSLEIGGTALTAGESVTVLRQDGSSLSGTVDTVLNGVATVLVPDRDAAVGENVTVLGADGNSLGSGSLAIHSPMRISGITGTVSNVYAVENQTVYAGSALFGLTDLSYTAHYQTLLRDREKLEDQLMELMSLYRFGGLTAPFTGSVSSIDYDESTVSSDAETAILTLSPDKSMEVTLNVDESNILSLEIGQSASVTVSSIGDEVFRGSLTEINKTATSSSGVTRYSAVVTLDKTPEMLQGMSAKVVIRIQGVEGALIIPVEALHQTSSTSYVYTSYDEETKEFGGLVEVTVGIQNSSYVEITSGLREGDTVYYTKTETNPFGSGFPGGDFSGSGGFPGGDFGGSGGFPGGSGSGGNRPGSGSGGNRPSGGGSGFPGGSNGGFPSGGRG